MAPPQPKTPAMVLQELSVKNKWSPPQFDIVNCIQGTHQNRFDYKVHIQGIVGLGTGTSKQIAKHKAAMDALRQLQEIGEYQPTEIPVMPFDPIMPQKKPSPDDNKPRESLFQAAFSYIMPLREMCSLHKVPDPVFELISDIGPPHAKEFTYECRVSSIKTEGIASTKKMAQHIAAKDMIDRIKDILPDLATNDNHELSSNAITEVDAAAMKKYSEFEDFIPDKSIKILNYGECIQEIMKEKELSKSDFTEHFGEITLSNLKQILDKLGLQYCIYKICNTPHIMSLSLNTNSPFTTIGTSKTSEEEATFIALKDAFHILKCLMGLDED